MLLTAKRDFSRPACEEDLNSRARASKPVLDRMYFVGESMSLMNWDMATFLIDQGVTIMCRSYSEYTYPDGYMLADAVRALIDKESGEFIKLRQKVTIWNTRQFFTGGSSSGAVPIDQQLYFFSEGDRVANRGNPQISLMALSPS